MQDRILTLKQLNELIASRIAMLELLNLITKSTKLLHSRMALQQSKIEVSNEKWNKLLTSTRKLSELLNKLFTNMSRLASKGILSTLIADSAGFSKQQKIINETLNSSVATTERSVLKLRTTLAKASLQLGKVAKDGSSAFWKLGYTLQLAQDQLDAYNREIKETSKLNPQLAKSMLKLSELIQQLIILRLLLQTGYQKASMVALGFNNVIDAGANGMIAMQRGLTSFINSIHIAIPGVTNFINAFDIGGASKQLQTTLRLAAMSAVLIGKGSTSFKAGLKNTIYGVANLVTNLAKTFAILFRGILVGALGAMAAIFTAGLSFYDQLQHKLIGFQNQYGALSGMESKAWAAGGLDIYGALSAGALLSTFMTLLLYTNANAKHMSRMLLGAQVAQSDSAKVLQIFKLITGLTLTFSRDMEIVVANVAIQNKILPRKLMQDIANASLKVYKFSGGNAKELVKSALFAKRLQITMDDIANTAEGLLNILLSISNAMLLQILTGRSINILPAINMAAMGKAEEAAAFIIDQLGSSMDTNNVFVLQSISKLTGLSIDKIKTVYSTLQKSGKSALQVLKLTGQSVTDTMDDKKLKTSTAGQLTQLLAIERQIKFILLEGAQPLIKFLFLNTPAIIEVVRAISNAVKNLSIRFIDFINKEDGINKIKNALLWMVGAVLKTINTIFKLNNFFDRTFGKYSTIAKVTTALLIFSKTFQYVVWTITRGILSIFKLGSKGIGVSAKALTTANMVSRGYTPTGLAMTPWRSAATGRFVSMKPGSAAATALLASSVSIGRAAVKNALRPVPIIGALITSGVTAVMDYKRKDITSGQKIGRSAGSGVGTILGGAIGGAFLGPLGAVAGGIIGLVVGKKSGLFIGKMFSSKEAKLAAALLKKKIEWNTLKAAVILSGKVQQSQIKIKNQLIDTQLSSILSTRKWIEQLKGVKDAQGKLYLTDKERIKITDQLTKALEALQLAKAKNAINSRLTQATTTAMTYNWGDNSKSSNIAYNVYNKIAKGGGGTPWLTLLSQATATGDQRLILMVASAMSAIYLGQLIGYKPVMSSYNNSRKVPGGATGGRIYGAGTATSDSIPAFLSNGEYVVNERATATNYGVISRINNGETMHDERVPKLLAVLIQAVNDSKRITINGRVASELFASSAGAAKSIY